MVTILTTLQVGRLDFKDYRDSKPQTQNLTDFVALQGCTILAGLGFMQVSALDA